MDLLLLAAESGPLILLMNGLTYELVQELLSGVLWHKECSWDLVLRVSYFWV